ncbi:MAG: nucleotidyl transferase AbiEii/AbiGii toxin family protein [Kiritimatiellae bacterium]|nr:nucleotidyl transferase AbiEii/AbiGii toxin family protein [Kiritimatiellia bacterium]MBQ3289430.1 nucleotidyl transferase AbiEii/AbiGii toxin family protein [Kiritimatiellia bacterium]
MEGRYLRQSELVVRCIPSIAEESCFAIKGGTAINLFELDLPRLSVDIDLTFLPVSGRDTAIREINAALDRIAERLRARGFLVRMHGTDASRKMTCFANGAEIKVEPNFILRGTVYPTRQLELAPKMSEIVGASAEMAVLSREELYGGKFCAALDRQHPRDLFDVAQFFGGGGTVDDVKGGFIALALGHNRPLHEMLAPNMLDQSETFASQFAGMSDVPFEYDEHVATFRRLVADINDSLTREDRERLVAFTALEVDADVFGIPGLEKLPAVIWKRMNLETLRQRDARKFADNALALERILL